MIKAVKIKNFRSIEDQPIELAPITFIYGNNAAGKSSLFYSLNILRNVVSNPNQAVDGFFNLGFANLGTFKQVVHRHDESKSISIAIDGKINEVECTYGVNLNPKQGEFFLHLGAPYSLDLSLPVTFPYPVNLNTEKSITIEEVTYSINWTGVTAQVTPTPVTDASNQQAKKIALHINRAAELIRSVDLVSVRRGFFEPQYGAVNITQFPIKEEEVAALLSTDENLDNQVSAYLEQTVGRQFRAKPKIGTSLAALTTIEPATKNNPDIVNDGFGVNQLVYVFAKILNKSVRTACVEEPEVNLHPGVVRKLPKTLIEIVNVEKKQLLVATHSEALIIAMLSAIANGEIEKNKVLFYLTTRPDGNTIFASQEVSDDGKIAGGLTSFMAGELEDIEGFLKARKKKSKEIKTVEENGQAAQPDAPITEKNG